MDIILQVQVHLSPRVPVVSPVAASLAVAVAVEIIIRLLPHRPLSRIQEPQRAVEPPAVAVSMQLQLIKRMFERQQQQYQSEEGAK